MDQFVLIPFSQLGERYNTGLLDVKRSLEPVEKPPNWNAQHERLLNTIKGKHLSLNHTNMILNNPRIKLSEKDTIIIDGTDTDVHLVDFVYNLNRKTPVISDIYYHILDVVGIDPNTVRNDTAKQRDRGSWIPFVSK